MNPSFSRSNNPRQCASLALSRDHGDDATDEPARPVEHRGADDPHPGLTAVAPAVQAFQLGPLLTGVDARQGVLSPLHAAAVRMVGDPVTVGVQVGGAQDGVAEDLLGTGVAAVHGTPLVGHDDADRHGADDRAQARLAGPNRLDPVQQLAVGPRQFAFRDDARGRFRHDQEDAGDATLVVPQRAVAVGEERFLWLPVTIRGISRVLDVEGLSGQDPVEDGGQFVPHLRPPFPRGTAEVAGMFVAEAGRVSVVVDRDQVRSPMQHHGELGAEHDPHRRLQGQRPSRDGTERVDRPIRGSQPLAGRTTSREA